ncbi:MAG TPA: phosphatase PAP2 family protein [Terriglobia bacterium]|nr:phosphatase PAP2 family protein [Terriglobia bacterium]
MGYLVYITLLSFFLKVPSRWRGRLLAVNTALVAGLCFLPGLAGVVSQLSLSIFRDWLPAPLILLGYRESGRLTFPRADQSFEKAFLRWDKRIFRKGLAQFLDGNFPRWFDALLEFSYLQCYVIVPSGVAVLYLAHQRNCVDHYWSIVLPSVFVAYGLTPLFPAQPPRKLSRNSLPAREPLLLRRFNLWIHDHASIRVNTFPSGHVAGAAAASLAMIHPLPVAAVCYFIIAIGIVLGSVRGRYHYSVDALAGALVAVAAYLCNLFL